MLTLPEWRRRARIPALMGALLAPVAGACAGQIIEARMIRHTGPRPEQCRIETTLDGSRVRIHIPMPAGRPDTVLYLPDQDVLRQINHSGRSYMEFDTRVIGRAGDLAKTVRDFVEEKVAAMTKSGRPGNGGVRVRAADKTEIVAGLSCRRYVVLRGEEKVQEIWATPFQNVGLRRRQTDSLRQLALYYENLTSALEGAPFLDEFREIPLGALVSINAYPVLVRQYRGGRLAYAVTIGAPKTAEIGRGAFLVPPGYTKQQIWSMSR